MFFDDHPRFLDTSETSATLDRLNLRHEAIITDNADVLRDSRVLDIVSHDGRFTFAALKAGASYVIGLEARQHLVDNSKANFAAEGAAPNTYDFVCADVYDRLAKRDLEVDVVMCLGFLYHTTRYAELFAGIRATGARHIIMDTAVLGTTSKQPFVRIGREHTAHEWNAVGDPYSYGGRSLVGKPSVAALKVMLEMHDYSLEKTFDWKGLLDQHPDARSIAQYRTKARMTMRAKHHPQAAGGAGELAGTDDQAGEPPLSKAEIKRARRRDRLAASPSS